MNRFSKLHSISLVSYFTVIVLVLMISSNPILQGIALITSILYYVFLNSKKTLFYNLTYYAILFVLIAVTNPLFSHNGKTPLFFMNSNPITLEAILKGVSISTMLISTILWLSFCSKVLTSEKILQFFGRFSPKLALVFSMTLNFVPNFKRKFVNTEESLLTLGIFSCESRFDRLRLKIATGASVLMNFAEISVEMSDSMNSRGYGLKGRTTFSKKKFGIFDWFIFLYSFVFFIYILTLEFCGKIAFEFYPTVSYIYMDFSVLIAFCGFGILCLLPIVLEILEGIKWKFLLSKI